MVRSICSSFSRFKLTELIVRVLKYYQVDKPTHIPARIIQAVSSEKASRAPKDFTRIVEIINNQARQDGKKAEFSTYGNLRSRRDELIRRFPDMEALRKYCTERLAENRKEEIEKSS